MKKLYPIAFFLSACLYGYVNRHSVNGLAHTKIPQNIASIPSPPMSGAGLVPVTFGNASPDRMQIIFKNKSSSEQYRVEIEPCPTCRLYVDTPPPGCPEDTVYQTFALNSEDYEVSIYSGRSTLYTSPLNLRGLKQYKTCVRLTYNPKDKKLQ